MNVIEDGAHAVADTVLTKAEAQHCAQMLWIAPLGEVTIASVNRSWRRSSPPPDSALVGCYTRKVGNKAIRDDIAAHIGVT